MQRLPINDVNLRLILSKDHDKWFRKEIRDRWVAIAVLTVLLAVCLSSTAIWFLTDDNYVPVIYIDETVSADTAKSYEDDGYVVKQQSAEFGVSGQGRLPFGTDHSILSGNERTIFTIMMIAAPFLLMFVARAFLEIRKLMRWQKEHHAFLAAHGHTP